MANQNDCMDQWDCDCECRNQLDLDKLCVKHMKACRAKIKDLCVKNINVEEQFCAKELSSPKLCVDVAVARDAEFQTVCAGDVNSRSACVQNLSASNASISNLVANDLCVPGQLKAANLLQCGKYRATMVIAANKSYTLGSDVVFDSVLDDPNGNINIAVSNYTVPVSGYYLITYKINQSTLVTGAQILGAPIANPEIYVNGVLAREAFSVYLTFNNDQKSLLDTMMILTAGDVITLRYELIALDAVSGRVNIAGTVILEGNGTDFNSSLFMVHLLSVNCPDLPCQPSIPCVPCQPMSCVPCTPMPCHRDCDTV